ncbi:MAG: ABC transporter ATP-binding protein [Planctomycetota bacterium]
MSYNSRQSEVVVSAHNLGKCYNIYDNPEDRLKQAFWWGRRKYYREFWALRNVSFEVKRGEALGVIGRNGSGKSTLLQIIAGTLTPSEGEVSVRGRVAALLELGSGFNPDFTGRENVFMNGAMLGISNREMEKRFSEIEAFADIGEFIDQPVKTYSSGMFVRLAFSVATNVDPDILIVDEALSVGDMMFQHKCIARIRKLCESGVTSIFVSHAPDTVRALCQDGMWLDNGQMKMLDSAQTVSEQYMESLFLESNIMALDQTPEEQAIPEESLTALQSTLESLDGSEVIGVEWVRILNQNGMVVDSVGLKKRFSIEVMLRTNVDINHVSIGFVIKDHLGIELTGESIFNKFRRGVTLKAGEPLRVRFSAVNNLRPGDYSVAVRVNRVSKWDRSDNVLMYSNDLAAAFHVAADPEMPMWFRFHQPFEVTFS